MKKILKKIFSCILFLFFIFSPCLSQEWREQMDSLHYAPRYFGPNAFPIPDVNSGKIESAYTIGFRYDFHKADGDDTRNIYADAYIPFGKAAIEVNWIIREYYRTTEELRIERYAANTKPTGKGCHGDIVFNSKYQLLENEKWFDAILCAGLKTASGNKLSDARFTDAASYWFHINFGKDLYKSNENREYLRVVAIGGFYCYMTNRQANRQNDAWMAGGGIKYRYQNIYFDADVRGFEGYWNNGDEPLLFHTKFRYQFKKHSLYARYQYGMNDYIYRTFSLGYNFSFNWL